MPANRDPDGDSEMISSPSSPELESSNANTSSTQQIPASTGAQSLSQSQIQPKPLLPRSQSSTSQEPMTIDSTAMQDVIEAREVLGATSIGDTSSMTQAQKDYLLAEPGSAWKSKKAVEEYRRAMESVVDQDFNLDEFGDPFDERDMEIQGK